SGFRATSGQKQATSVLLQRSGHTTAPMSADAARHALRMFMTRNRLHVTQWAKDAGVPVAQIYGFLTGRTHSIAPETLSKLADVVGVQPQELLETRR
ncbi:MAG: helix-turn-helix transcriptional regulator, partial [Alphaproteobacteria bacterium]|nr:helix-turn-helix transcriptional regulator [Alphaproteobacteria bacterium]